MACRDEAGEEGVELMTMALGLLYETGSLDLLGPGALPITGSSLVLEKALGLLFTIWMGILVWVDG